MNRKACFVIPAADNPFSVVPCRCVSHPFPSRKGLESPEETLSEAKSQERKAAEFTLLPRAPSISDDFPLCDHFRGVERRLARILLLMADSSAEAQPRELI
jgi:hypothetical protein